MRRVLSMTLLFIFVPSFFMLAFYKEEEVVNEIVTEKEIEKESIYINVKQIDKNKIVKLDVEKYVKGVIAGEMPISFDIEALKALAVAARTYAVRRINENNTYDVVDTVM